MKFKVHLQNIWPDPGEDKLLGPNMGRVYQCAEEIFRKAFGADGEIQQGFNPKSVYYSSSAYLGQYNTIGILEGLEKAQADGCDVGVIVCGNDPGLLVAREAFEMPIVSVGESGMLVATMLGRRFAAICMDVESERVVEANMLAYGLESRAIHRKPVRTAAFMEDFSRWCVDEDYLRQEVIPKFEEVARDAIADGAEVIVTACGGFCPFSRFAYNRITGTDVPVVESKAAAAHIAYSLASLNRQFGISTSKHGTFKSLPKDLVSRCLANFHQGNAA